MRKTKGSYSTYSSLVKLQPRFLRLQWKTCLWAELQPWVPEFAVKDLPLGRTFMMLMLLILPMLNIIIRAWKLMKSPFFYFMSVDEAEHYIYTHTHFGSFFHYSTFFGLLVLS